MKFRKIPRGGDFTSSARGQSLVEMALLMPLLMLILLGTIDLGRAYFTYISLTNAARESARYGASNPNDPDGMTATALVELSNSGVDTGSAVVALDESPGSASGDTIIVTVSLPYQLFTTFIFGAGQINLQTSATMTILPGFNSGPEEP